MALLYSAKSAMARAALTEQAAAEFVWRHGRGALAILTERAETAERLGHRVAARSWRELAYAAARLLQAAGVDDGPGLPALAFLASAAAAPPARHSRSRLP